MGDAGYYRCHQCGKTFREPVWLKEPDGLDDPPYRYSDHCPFCGSNNYSEEHDDDEEDEDDEDIDDGE